MPRDITDADGGTWSCIQAFAGLGNDPAKTDAARVDGSADRLHVVCTPSGGARSVRIELPEGWEKDSPDEEIEAAIRSALD
jgi:hypothetical protein